MKRGCEAKNARSKAGSLEKSGGFGNTPWVNAKARIGIAMQRSKISSTAKRGGDRRIARVRHADVLVRNSRTTSPPRAGTTLLKP